ncbi:MAG TPA: VOC family protein [Streptosporangiaceae bacterium]|jgi:catechol 2,3-dioxygenase-like lactoylglutathione lyase family enzyme
MGADYDPDEEPLGGDLVCWAALVCPECGGMTTEGHRPGCPTQPGASAEPAAGSRLVSMHLEHTAVVVDDYDRAIDFFVNALGFELVEDSPDLTTVEQKPKRWVVVRPPGAETGLLLAQADGPGQQAVVGHQHAGRVGFFLRVDDFDAAYQRMKQAGVEFAGEPRSERYGQVVVFRDVAGNRWDLLGPRPE